MLQTVAGIMNSNISKTLAVRSSFFSLFYVIPEPVIGSLRFFRSLIKSFQYSPKWISSAVVDDINTNTGILKTISNELWLSTLISSLLLIYVSNSIPLIIQGVFGVILPFVCLLSSCHARKIIVKLVRVDLHI